MIHPRGYELLHADGELRGNMMRLQEVVAHILRGSDRDLFLRTPSKTWGTLAWEGVELGF